MAGLRIKDLGSTATALAETDDFVVDASGFSAAKRAPRSLLGSYADNTLCVSRTNGVDGSAIAGRLDRPYQTIQAALAAAAAGQNVRIYAGNYNLTSPLVVPDGVTLWCDPNVTITATNCFVFDVSTGISFQVRGRGDFLGVDGSGGAGSIAGVLRVNHASANVTIEGRKLRLTQTVSQDSSAAAVIKQTLAARCIVTAEEINSDGDTCIWWEKGDLDVQAPRISFDGSNAVSQNPVVYTTVSAANNKLWITADEIFSDNPQTPGLWIGDGSDPASAVWIDAKEVRTAAGSQFRTANFYNGKTYLRAMKVFANSTTGYGIWTAIGATGLYYVDVQKIEASVGINVNGGTSWMDVGEFNDHGATNFAISSLGGSHNIRLQTAIGTAATAGGLVTHQGGTLRLEGAYLKPIDGAGNYPVQVSASGLTLRNCLLIAPAAPLYAINAASGQTVQLVGCAGNKTTNNITVKGAALTVDAALT